MKIINLEHYKGKMLDEFMCDYSGEVFIGTKSGGQYFFIGNADEWWEKENELTNYFTETHQHTFDRKQIDVKKLCAKEIEAPQLTEFTVEGVKLYVEGLREMAKEIEKKANEINRISKHWENSERRVVKGVPLGSRHILDIYEKPIYGGLAIIIEGEGNEKGFWYSKKQKLKAEYQSATEDA